MSSITRRDILAWGVALSASSLLHPLAWSSPAAALAHPGDPGQDSTAPANPLPPLSWERDHPARGSWSEHLIGEVTRSLPTLAAAQDIADFFPCYPRAGAPVKAILWSELVVLLAFFESAWEPCARYKEPGMGKDTVTHEPVFSEGLLQLSYQDMDVYPNLPFDWEKDKTLPPTDCRKTILDPFRNLSAGVQILATQVQTYGKIVLNDHIYWSTLQDPATGKHSRVDRIKTIAQKWAGAVSVT